MPRLSNIKISKRILLGFSFAALLTLIVASVSIYYLRNVGQRLTSIAEQDQLLLTSALELQVAVEQESDGIRGYLLSGDQSFLEPFTTGQSYYFETITKLEGIIESQDDRRLVSDINRLNYEFLKIAEEEITLHDQGFPQSAVFLWQRQGNKVKSDLNAKLTSFVERRESIIFQNTYEARSQQNQALIIAMTLVVFAWAAGTTGSIWISRSITWPIGSLVSATEAISRGDLTIKTSIPGTDELAWLGSTMNQMVSDLARSRETAECLLAETQRRGEQLRAINDVGCRISSILSLENLLPYVVNSVREAFNYYNINIFMLNPNSGKLVLKAGAGGYNGSVPVGSSVKVTEGIVGWVVQNGEVLVANDISREPKYLFVPELADTQSELAVPIKVGTKSLGVLDIESTERNAFDEIDLFTAQTLADQIAIAIENAGLYQETENLLLNILPMNIAKRLKAGEQNIADSFSQATVLFADIVDFTKFCSNKSPVEVVATLNQVFSLFDSLVDKYNLEKIKTQGDAYIVVAGLPLPRSDHAEAVANLALEMRETLHGFRTKDGDKLEMRFGINTGPVSAGIIGNKKFIYDIWGNTVNIASRIECKSLSNFILVTHSTYQEIKDKFLFSARGRIYIKGEGMVKAYYLEDRFTLE